jgi:hypothetical protein
MSIIGEPIGAAVEATPKRKAKMKPGPDPVLKIQNKTCWIWRRLPSF